MPSAAFCRYRIAGLLLALVCSFAARGQNPLLPSGVAYDASGNLYFADTNRHQVFESTLAGQLLIVAGNGTQGFSGDGGPATAASLDSPQSVAVGPDGTVYVADTGNQRIRAIVAGVFTTFAGTGASGFGGDNGPALSAIFSHPNALAMDTTGALLVCDSGNHRVRRIASGTVTTVAGSGVQGFGGDNGPALLAQLDTPSGIAVAADGRIFIADTHNQRIRVIATSGNISTYAGTGVAGYAGDGAAATLAQLALPRGLFAASTGALLIADSNNQRIRQIDAQGMITTIAGNGIQGGSNDGAAATAASLNTPRSVVQSAFSAPVFADTGNALVRELVTNGNLYAPAGLVPSRTSSVAIAPISGATYGQPVATVTVSGSAGTPQGSVQLFDNGTPVALVALTSGSASIASLALFVGQHTLTASYLGDGVNPAAMSASVAVTITKTASATTLQPTPTSYAGLPIVLTANVLSTTQGTPTGTVTFTEGGAVIATSSLVAGVATGVDPAPAAGTHSFVATYSGDANFSASTSAALTATVGPLPDFTVAPSSSTTQTVLAGAIAVYTFTVASQPAPFTGAISMGVGVLPAGVTAAFSPPQVIPGTGAAQVTLTLQTSASMVRLDAPGKHLLWIACLLPFTLAFRRRGRRFLQVCAIALIGLLAQGCGDRTLSAGSQANLTFPLTVSGTGTNLVGAVVVHTAPITLIVQ